MRPACMSGERMPKYKCAAIVKVLEVAANALIQLFVN